MPLIRDRKWADLEVILESEPDALLKRDINGNTVIHLACQKLRRPETAEEKHTRVRRGIITTEKYVPPHYVSPSWALFNDSDSSVLSGPVEGYYVTVYKNTLDEFREAWRSLFTEQVDDEGTFEFVRQYIGAVSHIRNYSGDTPYDIIWNLYERPKPSSFSKVLAKLKPQNEMA